MLHFWNLGICRLYVYMWQCVATTLQPVIVPHQEFGCTPENTPLCPENWGFWWLVRNTLEGQSLMGLSCFLCYLSLSIKLFRDDVKRLLLHTFVDFSCALKTQRGHQIIFSLTLKNIPSKNTLRFCPLYIVYVCLEFVHYVVFSIRLQYWA